MKKISIFDSLIVQQHIETNHDDVMTWKLCYTFQVTDPLWGGSTDHKWIPLTNGQYHRVWVFPLVLSYTSYWTNGPVAQLKRHDSHVISL